MTGNNLILYLMICIFYKSHRFLQALVRYSLPVELQIWKIADVNMFYNFLKYSIQMNYI